MAGLLRTSEPGCFMRHNDPAREVWYTRDVPAIARARGLERVAPYLVDEDAAPGLSPDGSAVWPKGGMTVISFPDNHLSYLITWYLLAAMVLAAAVYVGRDEYRLRRRRRGAGAPGKAD